MTYHIKLLQASSKGLPNPLFFCFSVGSKLGWERQLQFFFSLFFSFTFTVRPEMPRCCHLHLLISLPEKEMI